MRKIISFILILSLIVTLTVSSTSMAFAEDNGLLDSLNKGITILIENGAENLKTVLNMIDDLIKYTVEKFSDIKESDWFTKTVSKLVGMGGIDGYTDGTFQPNKEMNKGEFTKLLISTLGYEEENAAGEHWSMNYIRRAEKLTILDKGEFKESTLDDSISRYEMAKMAVRSLDEEYPDNLTEYANQIKDYNDIPSEYKEYVLKAYVKGLITGYEDGTFKGAKGLTRAEASTVVVRIIDETERKIPELEEVEEPQEEVEVDKTFIEPEFKIHYYKSIYATDYFGIWIKNYEDYEDQEHWFTTECVSHPEINTVNWKTLEIDDETKECKYSEKVRDRIKESKMSSKKFNRGEQIYGLYDFYEWKPVDSEDAFEIEDGTMMKFKITVTNGKTTKEYNLNIEFKDKEYYQREV